MSNEVKRICFQELYKMVAQCQFQHALMENEKRFWGSPRKR